MVPATKLIRVVWVASQPTDAEKPKPVKRRTSYLTVAQFYKLNVACRPIKVVFGGYPYLVGSVLHRPDYRDVDLRLLMSEERGSTDFEIDGDRRLFLNTAVSTWLTELTGLPIDFQFQPLDEWVGYDGEMRNPIGMLPVEVNR